MSLKDHVNFISSEKIIWGENRIKILYVYYYESLF